MTGRGKLYYHQPRSNPDVTVGISLSASHAQFDPASDSSLFLVVTARIISTPRPEKAITLATCLSPLHFLGCRSFTNINCTSPETAANKSIEISSVSRFKRMYVRDMREASKFVTIEPGKTTEIKHKVPKAAIRAAGLETGEKYKVEITDTGLGTDWWVFASWEELEGMKFKRWSDKNEEEVDDVWASEEEEEDNGAPWVKSEEPMKLALVIEQGEVEFVIV